MHGWRQGEGANVQSGLRRSLVPAYSLVQCTFVSMNLTIIGGSQGTGAQLAQQAIEAGHKVTVVSRSGRGPAGAQIITGSATDPEVVRKSLFEATAVAITVGGSKDNPQQRTEVTRSVIAAMNDVEVSRLIVQSSLGAGDSMKQLPALLRPLMKVVLAKPLADHDRQEAAVQASGLDWTIVRPSGLKDGEGSGNWATLTTEESGTLKGTVQRADVAAFMLSILEDAATFGKAYGMSKA